MTPTPVPGMMRPPVVCGTSVTAVANAQLDTYVGPRARSRTISIVTAGPFAYVGWGVGESGGQSVYRHVEHRWCKIANGGGALDRADLDTIAGPVYGKRLWESMNSHR